MNYKELKQIIINLFDYNKLKSTPEEWGFYNEMDRNIAKMGYCTNITPEIIQKAAEEKVDFMLTHHDSWEFLYGMKEACNQLLEENNITHCFFHAPLDDAAFGTSSALAAALELKNTIKAMPYLDLYNAGVIGEIEPVDFNVFIRKFYNVVKEDVRFYKNHNREIQKIAVVAGGGNMTNEIRIAVEHGCDAYITGEYSMYAQEYAEFSGINLVLGTHTGTEILGIKSMVCQIVQGTDLDLVRIKEPNY